LPGIFVRRKARFNSFVFAGSFVGVELLLRTIPFTGFGWSRIGFTQIDSPIAALYPVGGVVFVSFIIAFLSATRRFLPLVIALSIVGLANFVPDQIEQKNSIRIALVQGGVPELGLGFNSTPKEVFNRHLEQTKKLSTGNELIIWPENSVDIDINTNPEVYKEIVEQSVRTSSPILVGGVTKSPDGLRNQSILFNSQAQQIYTKRYLTPFGEYLPLRNIAEAVSPYAKEITDFAAGQEDTKFKISNFTFQTLICYELINDVFRDSLTSDFLVVQTNNATFGDTSQLEQELNIARVRSMETGRNVAYVSTTGVTSFISNNGTILQQIPKFTPNSLIGQIDTVDGTTLTQDYGKYLEALFLIPLLLLTILRRVKK
jgi:apolipoprotein N-acyltransferase